MLPRSSDAVSQLFIRLPEDDQLIPRLTHKLPFALNVVSNATRIAIRCFPASVRQNQLLPRGAPAGLRTICIPSTRRMKVYQFQQTGMFRKCRSDISKRASCVKFNIFYRLCHLSSLVRPQCCHFRPLQSLLAMKTDVYSFMGLTMNISDRMYIL